MKDFFSMVSLMVISFFIGTVIMEGNVWGGVAAAAATVVAVQLGKLWKRFWGKHPKLAAVGKTLCWALVGILIIILCLAGVPLIPLAVGAVLIIAFISAFPGIRQKEKQKTEEFLEENHQYWQQNTEDYRRRKALDEQKRKAARAEAEHLEDMARLWERNAKKYGTASDIRKARDFREQANAAWRKIR